MNRLAAVLVLASALAACGRGDGAGAPLQGKWGWFTPTACEGNRDVIEFSGSDFTHWGVPRTEEGEPPAEAGVPIREGRDTSYAVNEEGWVTATYMIDQPDGGTQTVALTLEPSMLETRNEAGEVVDSINVLLFRGSVIDGSAPETAADYIGQPLFACGGQTAAE